MATCGPEAARSITRVPSSCTSGFQHPEIRASVRHCWVSLEESTGWKNSTSACRLRQRRKTSTTSILFLRYCKRECPRPETFGAEWQLREPKCAHAVADNGGSSVETRRPGSFGPLSCWAPFFLVFWALEISSHTMKKVTTHQISHIAHRHTTTHHTPNPNCLQVQGDFKAQAVPSILLLIKCAAIYSRNVDFPP